MSKMLGVVTCGVGMLLPVLWAQDTRVVTEPKIPAACVVLHAEQTSAQANASSATETLDTARIQQALDHCAAGHAVELAKGKGKDDDAFVTGPLELRDGVTLLVDRQVTLYASRDPKVFEVETAEELAGKPGKCGTAEPRPTSFPTFAMGAARPRGGCRPLMTVSHATNAGIMGEGTIDGRGYAQEIGHDYSWWQMARKAQPHDDLYYSIRMIVADHADGFTLYGIHLVNSANYHVSVAQTNGFTAWGVHLQTPVNKALIGTDNDARNTDGIDPGTSENITIAHSWIDNGDDNIAIKQGVSHMSVIDDHFYSGHGMSIGSETVQGQSYLLVDGLSEDHTTSGIRIKSNVKRGGPVHDLVYANVCMRGVPIPIAVSPYYTNQTVEPFEDPKYVGDRIPDYKAITLRNIYSESAGDVLIAGLNDAHRTEITLDHVHIVGITAQQLHLAYDDIHTRGCSNDGSKWPATNLPLAQVPATVKVDGVACGGAVEQKRADPCADKFVPMQ